MIYLFLLTLIFFRQLFVKDLMEPDKSVIVFNVAKIKKVLFAFN